MHKKLMVNDIWKLSKEYFLGEKKWFAISILTIAFIFEFLAVYVGVLFTYWNRDLYDALQQFDESWFIAIMYKFIILLLAMISVVFIKVIAKLFLSLQWRTWMTERYLTLWMNKNAYYGTKVIGLEVDNPDQRISEDINNFTTASLDLLLSLISIIFVLVSFIPILWTIVDPLKVMVLGYEITIYGYLVWFALIYAVLATFAALKIGRPFTHLFFKQEQKEAWFRFDMMRVREYAESIALYDAGKFHKNQAMGHFYKVKSNFIQIIKYQLYFSVFNVFYVTIDTPIVILLMAPYYFAKTITLGVMMQVLNIFGRVNGAFSWIINSYLEIAKLRAVIGRLSNFHRSLHLWDDETKANKVKFKDGKCISIDNINIELPTGERLLHATNLHLDKHRYLITGASGCGKTTLLRVLSKHYPYARGVVQIPKNKQIMFVAQKSFMPITTLAKAICYPKLSVEEGLIQHLMIATHLEKHLHRLNHIADWGRELSGGEQQKISIMRAILAKPDILICDESFNALDDDSRRKMYELIEKYLPKTQLFVISHYYQDIQLFKNKLIIQDGILALR